MICDKSFLGLQRVEAHQNCPLKFIQPVEKPPDIVKTEQQTMISAQSSPGDQRVETHRNSPQKRTQWVDKQPGIFKTELQTMIQDEIVFWAWTCWGTPKLSPKTYSDGRKTPKYSQNWATDYDSGRNRLLGFNVLRHTKTMPKNVFRRSKNSQV